MKGRRYAWAVVGMLWLVCCFNYADRQAISAVFPQLREEFGFSAPQLGLIGSAFMYLYALGGPLAGFLADRFSRRRLILGGCLFWSLITAATALCTHYGHFLLVRGLGGLGEAFYFPAALSLMSEYHGRETRSRALSAHQSGVYVGTIAGSALGGWFAGHGHWRSAFLVFGLTGAAVALILFAFLREPPRHEAAARLTLGDSVRAAFARPAAWLLILVFVGANFVAAIFLTWTPTFLKDKFGYSLAEAGLYSGIFIQVASAAAMPVAGFLADRWRARHPGGRMGVQACGLLGGAAFIAVFALADRRPILIGAMIVFGFCKGLYDSNIWASFYDFIEPRARASAAGVMNTIGWMGGALGPLYIGLATKYGRHASPVANMSEGIACGAVLYLICGVGLILIAVKRAARDEAGSGPPGA